MDERAALTLAAKFLDPALREAHTAGHFRMNGPVLSHVGIRSGTVTEAFLTNQNLTRADHLAAKTLDATTLRNAVSAV